MRLGTEYKIKNFLNRIGVHSILIIVAVTCIFPLYWMFVTALKTQRTVFSDMSLLVSSPNWGNFWLAWTRGKFGIYFLNSIFYTVAVVLGVLFLTSLAAYAFARLDFPGKNFLFLMFLAAMMFPIPGAFIPLYVLLNQLGLINTRLGYILVQMNMGLSLGIYLLKTFFEEMPKELEDAARIDGCGKFGIYWHVALPLARPAIAVVTIFTALTAWNEFFFANLIFNDKNLMPLQKGLMVFRGEHLTQYPLLMAGVTIATIPIIILYLIMQRHIIEGITAGAVK